MFKKPEFTCLEIQPFPEFVQSLNKRIQLNVDVPLTITWNGKNIEVLSETELSEETFTYVWEIIDLEVKVREEEIKKVRKFNDDSRVENYRAEMKRKEQKLSAEREEKAHAERLRRYNLIREREQYVEEHRAEIDKLLSGFAKISITWGIVTFLLEPIDGKDKLDSLIKESLRRRIGLFLPWTKSQFSRNMRCSYRNSGDVPKDYNKFRKKTIYKLTNFIVKYKDPSFFKFDKIGHVHNKEREIYKYNDDISISDEYLRNEKDAKPLWKKFIIEIDGKTPDASNNHLQRLTLQPETIATLYKRSTAVRRLKNNSLFLRKIEDWRHDLWKPGNAMCRRGWEESCEELKEKMLDL